MIEDLFSDFPKPANEEERIKSLHKYNIINSLPEDEYDYIVKLAAHICNTPMALITFVDKDNQWFKSKIGLNEEGTSRSDSFCQYTIMNDETMLVENSKNDKRFKKNPLVLGSPNINFYAGHPIKDDDGYNLGALCVLDNKPRTLDKNQIEMLSNLSGLISALLKIRLKNQTLTTYKKFFDHSLDLLCVAGTDGYFKIINPAFSKILGYTDEYLLSKPFMFFVHDDDKKKTIEQLNSLRSGELAISFSNRYKTSSGNYVVLNWNTEPDIGTGELFAVAHDITQIQETNEKLSEVIKYKDIFLSNMSHEIRTPMNAIIGFSDLLKKTQLDQEQQDYLSCISTASDNMIVIIDDILDLSKMESGKLILNNQTFSLKGIIESVLKLMSPKSMEKGLNLFLTLDSDVPEAVIGDPARLTQILVNLVNNAIKFTEKGKIEIGVLVKKKSLKSVSIAFSVKDTGIGIPKDKMGFIFQRFEQINSNFSKLNGGTGLGLSIVEMIVSMHHGKIKVNSSLGIGSEFIVEINYKIGDKDLILNSISNNFYNNQLFRGKKILIAEDNILNQKLASKYLTNYGAEVDIANDGVICAEKVLKGKFDLILMDLQMPEKDGYQTAIKIRNEFKMSIPIIACTANLMSGEREKCMASGMNAYIGKPFSENELIQTILNLLAENKENLISEVSNSELIHKALEEFKAVEGQEFFKQIMPVFIKNIKLDIENLKQSLKNQDVKSCQMLAHKMKGSIGIFNFKDTANLAGKISSLKTMDLKKISSMSLQLITDIEDILKETLKYDANN